jgi:hypothetical protein
MASTRFSYIQKPAIFQPEHEFRFVVTVAGPPAGRFNGDHLPIALGRPLNYVTIISSTSDEETGER